MLKKERHDFIMRQINLHNRVLTSDLVQLLNVSEDTIRRDLNELAEEGEIIKIRGGAMSKAYHYSSQVKETYAHNSKQEIARKALGLLKEGMLVLVGGGTTIRELVKLIPDSLSITFMTVNPLTAVELLDKPNVDIIMVGGQLSRYSQMAVGGEVHQRLSEMRADLCIMGINSIDTQFGLSENDWEVVQIKKAMIKASKKTICIGISEKLNSQQKIKVANLDEIDILITELDPNDPKLLPYKHQGLTIY